MESAREPDNHNGPISNGGRWFFSHRGIWKLQEWKRSEALSRAGSARSRKQRRVTVTNNTHKKGKKRRKQRKVKKRREVQEACKKGERGGGGENS